MERRKAGAAIEATIIAIGREILTGRVLDRNSNYLAQGFFMCGLWVRRISSVHDDLQDISLELRRAKRQGARIVVTTGGLGPTEDDLTLQAVGMATGRAVVHSGQALEHVRRRYEELYEEGLVDSPDITPQRAKMARLPKGATLLENPVGTAPGCALDWGTTRVFCLPGVPAEMRPMAERYVFPWASRQAGKLSMRRVTLEVPERDESVVAAAIAEVASRFPSVHFKPDPKGYGKGKKTMVVHLETLSPTDDQPGGTLERAARALLDRFS